MNVSVERERFLAATCGDWERLVYDSREERYHLLRGPAAFLWDHIGGGGEFDLGTPHRTDNGEGDAIARLAEANLLKVLGSGSSGEAARRIPRRHWLGTSGRMAVTAMVLPLVVSAIAPSRASAVSPGTTTTTTLDP